MKSVATSPKRKIHLRLYTGQHPFDRTASLRQLHELLSAQSGSYELEVLDSQEFRELATKDGVSFSQVLVRLSPPPIVRLPMPQPSCDALKKALDRGFLDLEPEQESVR
jgi:hypothetical protein